MLTQLSPSFAIKNFVMIVCFSQNWSVINQCKHHKSWRGDVLNEFKKLCCKKKIQYLSVFTEQIFLHLNKIATDKIF